ncbi:CoA transferase [Marinobacter sp. NFXS11]|uniref:CaiB/BaiF CoA transferase family protein n=1 Tax=Marinobacter sp. NFXS11 TaxID=2818432 RepID=UPI0032DFC65A
MSHKPLAGRRVIEMGTMIAAPFATHILSQLGAEVIKVEPLTGDTTRALVRGGPSGTFIAYNHGKKSLAIDLTTADGRLVFHKLAETADVVIHNLSPAATKKLGITAEDLAKDNPDLIYCHVRGYSAGPMHDGLATNPVAEAATGVMDDHRIDGRPSRLGPSYHDQFAGAYAVIRVLATLMNPAPTPEEKYIEIGLYETGLHIASRDLAGVQLKTQLLGRPEKEAGGEFAMPGYGAYQTQDGRWIYLLILTDAHWRKLSQGLQMPEADDAQLAGLRERKKQRERVEAAVRRAIGSLSYEAATEKLESAGIGFTEVLPLERVLEAPQARHPGKLRTLEFGGLKFDVPEFPGDGAIEPGLAPPHLGQHTLEILEQLGFDDGACANLLEESAVSVHADKDHVWAPRK